MLEKVSSVNSENLLRFKAIAPDSNGSGICYVRGGIHKYTRANKPFITLFLQDIDGNVIPGYIFDVENFKAAGLELTRAIHSVVKITYTENFLPRYGLTLILDKVELINDAGPNYLSYFVGSAKEAAEKYQQLMDELSRLLNIKVTVPYTICTMSHMDYRQGETGGLCLHYWDMLRVLKIYAEQLANDEERFQLYGTFLLYIYAHSNFLSADDKGEADISLIVQLTAAISRYKAKLKIGEGAVEVVHTFFGYEPKDIYVRLVCQVSGDLIKANKEISVFKTLPDSREGNAGYGTIHRYPLKQD